MVRERGFTLVESVITVFVIGVFLGCLFPLVQELRMQSIERTIQSEAKQYLQEQMEKTLASFEGKALEKEEKKRSRTVPNQFFYLKSVIHLRGENLWEIMVQIRWEGSAKIEQKKLVTHRFIQNGDGSISNRFSH
jgi:prepilin-type N-terminal cleavage/methylation domain-containing protein